MRKSSQPIIERIGATDQLYLQGNTPELALERADLRLQLTSISLVRQEQVHFLQEAIVLLEQGRIEFNEMPLSLYIDLSLNLVKAYMMFFELTHETRYATITQQILKPITHDDFGDIYFFLAYASAAKDEPSLTRHWLNKYAKTQAFNISLLQEHTAFTQYHTENWFKQLLQSKLH